MRGFGCLPAQKAKLTTELQKIFPNDGIGTKVFYFLGPVDFLSTAGKNPLEASYMEYRNSLLSVAPSPPRFESILFAAVIGTNDTRSMVPACISRIFNYPLPSRKTVVQLFVKHARQLKVELQPRPIVLAYQKVAEAAVKVPRGMECVKGAIVDLNNAVRENDGLAFANNSAAAFRLATDAYAGWARQEADYAKAIASGKDVSKKDRKAVRAAAINARAAADAAVVEVAKANCATTIHTASTAAKAAKGHAKMASLEAASVHAASNLPIVNSPVYAELIGAIDDAIAAKGVIPSPPNAKAVPHPFPNDHFGWNVGVPVEYVHVKTRLVAMLGKLFHYTVATRDSGWKKGTLKAFAKINTSNYGTSIDHWTPL